ncbi:MAG: outer membrane protein assembly factor BamB family protein [Planctomycetota bacterium]
MTTPHRKTISRVLLLFVSAFMVGDLKASDWPMYRADATRSGYTSDHLPARLEISWIRKAKSPPQPAWSGRDTRMPFDLTFQPVVSGGLVFFGSSADCTVYALDAKSAREKWTYITDSPVRFAPAVWKDRLFVVSDDGCLYCLSVRSGELLWKKRGGPNSEMVLGNDRLISRWPARGGPVVKDGIVYFGAGLWPSEGIYLYALDASTGRTLWINDSSGDLVLEQPHGGNRARSGVSIQGYLAAAGNSLAVPTGRASPAVFDVESGRFRYFHLMKLGAGWGNRKGAGPFVGFIDENLYFVEDDVFQASNGRFLARGLPVSSTVVLPDMLVFARGKEIRAISKYSLWIEVEEPNKPPVRKLSLDNVAWKIVCSDPVGASVVRASASNETSDWPAATQVTNPPLVVAGQTIVAGTLNGKIVTADMDSKAVVTTVKLDGLALGLAVADRALYVGTDKGTIYRLIPTDRDEPSVSTDLQTHQHQADSTPYRIEQPYRRTARKIIKKAGIAEGYCVDLGCGDGSLAHALARTSRLHIIAVDEDPRKVALARKRLNEAGLYGSRVTVLQRDLADTGLPPHFAGLVVSERSVSEGPRVAPGRELRRLLHPYNGTALIGEYGSLRRTVGRAPAGAGEWTHQYADAANTLCSADALAAGPLKMRWFTDFGVRMASRHGRAPAPLCRDGIMIVEALHGLLAVDAYSGRRLWFYGIEDILRPYDQEHLLGTSGTGSNMCLGGDSVFVRHGSRCLRIDMKTGKLIREYTMPNEDAVWGFIACAGGTLFGTSGDRTHVVRQLFRSVSDMENMLTQSKNLFALDIKTGRTKWVHQAKDSIRHNAVAICDGRVYLIDKPKEIVDLPVKNKDKNNESPPTEEPTPAQLVCLDAENGDILWQQAEDIYGTTLAASSKHNVLLMSYQYSQRSFQLPSEKGDRLTGFRATDGKRLWDTAERYISRPIINGSTVYAQPHSFDLLTGIRDTDFVLEGRQPGGCGTVSGSTNLLLYRSGTLGYVDLSGGSATQNYGPARPGCWINAIVAGGLVLMPDATDRCTCSYLIKASLALVPAR